MAVVPTSLFSFTNSEKKTFKVGPNAVHVSEAEMDDSTQMLQSQASITITDPATGKAIGAITVGINLNEL